MQGGAVAFVSGRARVTYQGFRGQRGVKRTVKKSGPCSKRGIQRQAFCPFLRPLWVALKFNRSEGQDHDTSAAAGA